MTVEAPPILVTATLSSNLDWPICGKAGHAGGKIKIFHNK